MVTLLPPMQEHRFLPLQSSLIIPQTDDTLKNIHDSRHGTLALNQTKLSSLKQASVHYPLFTT